MKKPRPIIFDIAWFVPAAALLATFVVYPVIRTIGLSFFHKSLANGFVSEFAGLANFARAVTDSRFLASLWITFLFTAISFHSSSVSGYCLRSRANPSGRRRVLCA